MGIKTKKWDLADYLEDPEDIAVYLNMVLEDGDAGEIAYAIGAVARSKGMTRIAKETGLSREGLYGSLSSDGNPTLSTLLKVLAACGTRLRVEPVKTHDEALTQAQG